MVYASQSNIDAADALRAEQEDAQQRKEGTTIRVGEGAARVTQHSDGRTEVQDLGLRRSDSSPALRGDILDGAISQTGEVLNRSALTPDTLIKVNGIELRLAEAESIGIVTRAADGSYKAFNQAPPAPPPATEPSVEADNVTDTEQAPEQAPDFDPTNPDRAIRLEAASKIADALKRDGNVAGDLFEEAVQLWEEAPGLVDASSPRIAELLGKNSTAVMESLQEYHAQEAAWVAGQNGVVDMQGFLEFVQSKPGAMREAITRAVLEGDANTAWSGLAREFARSAENKHTDADILGADLGDSVKAFTGPDGKAWIEIDGEQLPWQEAHRRGLIRFV